MSDHEIDELLISLAYLSGELSIGDSAACMDGPLSGQSAKVVKGLFWFVHRTASRSNECIAFNYDDASIPEDRSVAIEDHLYRLKLKFGELIWVWCPTPEQAMAY